MLRSLYTAMRIERLVPDQRRGTMNTSTLLITGRAAGKFVEIIQLRRCLPESLTWRLCHWLRCCF